MQNLDYKDELVEVITPVRLNAYGNNGDDNLL